MVYWALSLSPHIVFSHIIQPILHLLFLLGRLIFNRHCQ
ncbi:putative membrane protein [Proteus mirabilis]|nr:putative membrane protein [Proteus mirabilis]